MESSYTFDREILQRAVGSAEYQAVVAALDSKGGKHNFRFNTTTHFRKNLTKLSKTINVSFVKLSLSYFHQESYVLFGKETHTLSKLYNYLNSYHANINQNAYLVEMWSNCYIKRNSNKLDKSDTNYDLYISVSNELSTLSELINTTIDLFFGQLVLHTDAQKVNQFVASNLSYQYSNYDDSFFFSYSDELWIALCNFKKKYNIPIRNIISYSFENIKVLKAMNLISYANNIKSNKSREFLKSAIASIKKDSEILNDTTKSFHVLNLDGELTTDIILIMKKNISNSANLYKKINFDLKRIVNNELNNR